MRFAHLETARGLASVIVIFSHFFLAYLPQFHPVAADAFDGTSPGWLVNGAGAVCFFFVLSGFVLTYRYFLSGDMRVLLRGAVKRFPRLYLSCAISVLLGFVVIRLGLSWSDPASAITGSGWLASYARADLPPEEARDIPSAIYQTVAILLVPGNDHYSTNLWTMPFEFWGSIGCFVLAWLLLACARLRLVLAILLVVAILVLMERYLWMLPQNYRLRLLAPPMVVGCLIALLHARGHRLPVWSATPLILAGLVALSQFDMTWDKVGGILLLLGLLAYETPPSWLTGRIGLFLGEMSFPLYVVHTIVLLSLGSGVFVAAHAAGFGNVAALISTFVAIMSASTLLACGIVAVERWWVPTTSRFAGRVVDGLPKVASPVPATRATGSRPR